MASPLKKPAFSQPAIGPRPDREVQHAQPTGFTELDQLLPRGGLPYGHLTQMVGPRGSGRTSLLVSVVAQVAGKGERSAIIDVEGELDPLSLVAAGIPPELVWVVVPPRPESNALWAADLLLRSGHFRLVVLDGVSSGVPTASWVRLQRQARESDAVLLVGGSQTALAPGSLQLQLQTQGVEWDDGFLMSSGPRRLSYAVEVDKGRGEAALGFRCPRRRLLSSHKDVADRRPAGWTEGAKRFEMGRSSQAGTP